MKFFAQMFLTSWFERIVRFGLGSIFVYAGFIKLLDPKAFARILSQYDIVPDFLLAPVAIGLPAIEFLAGIALILNIRRSLSVIFGLLVMFIFVLGYGIFNNLNIDCGCFSVEEIKGYNSLRTAFYRDLGMMGAVFFLASSRFQKSRQQGSIKYAMDQKYNKKETMYDV